MAERALSSGLVPVSLAEKSSRRSPLTLAEDSGRKVRYPERGPRVKKPAKNRIRFQEAGDKTESAAIRDRPFKCVVLLRQFLLVTSPSLFLCPVFKANNVSGEQPNRRHKLQSWQIGFAQIFPNGETQRSWRQAADFRAENTRNVRNRMSITSEMLENVVGIIFSN